VRLEEQAALDRDRAPAAQPLQARLDPLREHDVDGGCRVGRQPAHLLEDGVAEARLRRPVVHGDAEVRLLPAPLAEVHRAQLVDASELTGVSDGAAGRVVEVPREHADDQAIRDASFGTSLRGHGRHVGDDDPRLDEQAQLQPKLGSLRRSEQRPLAELLRQHDGDDSIRLCTQARDLSEHSPRRVGPGGVHVEPGLTAGEVEPARVDPGVAVRPRHVQGGELVAADAACVPDGALSGDIQCFDVDQDAVAHRKTLED